MKQMLRALLKKTYLFFLLTLVANTCIFPSQARPRFQASDFNESFVLPYDVTVNGRYTHEYHPILFEKSSYSLDDLEKRVLAEGMEISGRIIVAGYEEQAVPDYLTNYKVCTGHKINDEAKIKNKSGWVEQPHNKFGLMTGFLFRDVPSINEELFLNDGREPLFRHINLNLMPIYRRDSWVFQEHAFGEMFDFMLGKQRAVNECVKRGDVKKLFYELIHFWKMIYDYELRFGNRSVLCTQDTSFSIAHAEHLVRSPVSVLNYFVGPDITYPIKVTDNQKKMATYHAQSFVREIVKKLVPIDEEPTVYVLCSFVDGVGKSTLLGNIQNYQKYGEQFELYDPVDNSSSQLAEVYNFGENVFIADLPAQISHFTYKPDGMVYCDLSATCTDEVKLDKVKNFVGNNRQRLLARYKKLIQLVRGKVGSGGWFEPSLNDSKRPNFTFVRNLLLLKKVRNNKWIPFLFDNEHYLFNSSEPNRIRILCKLEMTDSVGLKNYDAEQMLFYDGIRFPMPYKNFLDDLIEKLQENGVKKVVFLNYLSLYPRSSREGPRLNVLEQILACLYKDFCVEQSLYGSFGSDAQLFSCLKKDIDGENRFLDSFRKEAIVRLALYETMIERSNLDIGGISIEKIVDLLRAKISRMDKAILDQIAHLTYDKIVSECKALERVHGKSKDFINVQMIDFNDVLKFNYQLQKLIDGYAPNDRFIRLWSEPADIVDSYKDVEGPVNKIITLRDDTKARLLYVFSPDNKNPFLLRPILKTIRASWYAALINIACAKKGVERCFAAPIWVKRIAGGKFAVLRKTFDKCQRKVSRYVNQTSIEANMPEKEAIDWGVYEGVPLLLNVHRAGTNRGLFAFSCDGPRRLGAGRYFCRPLFDILTKYKKEVPLDTVMTTSKFLKRLEENRTWIRFGSNGLLRRLKREEMRERENKKKNEKKNEKEPLEEVAFYADDELKMRGRRNLPKLRLGKKEEINRFQLVARAIITLESILKDVDSDIVVRKGNRKDFCAGTKLCEKVLFPGYCNVLFEDPLFESERDIEPFIEIELD